jgi:hypothetical protein
MLTFGNFKDGKYDTRIFGVGLDYMVSEVQNTELKAPKVSKNIPTVAEVTQGEVILFAAEAIRQMGEDGIFVLLEGREQTVNYVRTPLRFTLTLSDMSLIGKRHASILSLNNPATASSPLPQNNHHERPKRDHLHPIRTDAMQDGLWLLWKQRHR